MNVRRLLHIAVLAVLFLSFVAQPAVAEPVSDDHVDIKEITMVEEDGTTTVTVEYDTSFSVRFSTFLFGSAPLEERLVDAVGAEDEDDIEFVSLDSRSAELVYDGEADELSPEEGEYSLVISNGA